MGIEYSARIIVGLHRGELLDLDEDVIEDLDMCPPYYDGSDEAVLGIVILDSGDYSAKEMVWGQAKVDAAMVEFKEKTGLDGKLFLSPCGW